MFDDDLQVRANRLLSGGCRTVDFDRLFLGLRSQAGQCDCFREIGDFVAHRDSRTKGLTTQTGRDVFTSLDVWSLKLRGLDATIDDIMRAARANLRLASDAQLKQGCGCRRQTAAKRLDRAQAKIERREPLNETESDTLEYLGNRFIWKPAFSSEQLFIEFGQVLVRIIGMSDFPRLSQARPYLSCYALAVMHGSTITLESGHKARLFAGYANRDRFLEVKMEITFQDIEKPIHAPVCLFLTDLHPEGHCAADLVAPETPVLPNHWNMPIELGPDGRLTKVA